MSERLLTLRQAAKQLGADPSTLRRWDNEGRLQAVRTPGGHRRYRLSDIQALQGQQPESAVLRAVVYCRVSSHDQKQKGDLERQVGRVSAYCAKKEYQVKAVLREVGSGMSDTRSKLHRLFKLVNEHKVDVVVVEHKDRLCRFSFGFLESYFASHGVRIEWVRKALGKSYEEELVSDILSLMSSFSARIYGRRSAANRKRKAQENEGEPWL